MPTRTARTAWNGTLQEGSGQLELSSSGAGTFSVSFPKRAADDADGTTSPEEMIAAAHSSCFSMALALKLGENQTPPGRLEVDCTVTLDAVDGVPTITTSALTVKAQVDELDADRFAAIVDEAAALCPVSRLFAGAEVSVQAELVQG